MKTLLKIFLYFLFSSIFTWWFVASSPLYISNQQMLLSTGVAGGKWGLQILMAFLFLKEKKWVYIKHLAGVCLIGSFILLPFVVLNKLKIMEDHNGVFFLGSLIAAVIAMLYYAYKSVKISDISIHWWYLWILCLFIAVSLQLTLVFHVIVF